MNLANRVPLSEWEGGDYIIGANQAGKCACSLLNCISVTDDSETNEQNKSIATGLLYAQVNQKLLYRESDWWYVGLVVRKARKQGTVYVKGRFGRILATTHSPEFANEEAYLQM